MQQNFETERLQVRTLSAADTAFIFELLNTEGWLKFIGDRNIKNNEDAGNYISRIISNPNTSYRVVMLQQSNTPIGLVTIIKRDYLDHPDLGFAFLPAYNKQGYAAEAAGGVLTDLLKPGNYSTILAITIPENNSSIQLLKKLGFEFSTEITHEGELLRVFAIHAN